MVYVVEVVGRIQPPAYFSIITATAELSTSMCFLSLKAKCCLEVVTAVPRCFLSLKTKCDLEIVTAVQVPFESKTKCDLEIVTAVSRGLQRRKPKCDLETVTAVSRCLLSLKAKWCLITLSQLCLSAFLVLKQNSVQYSYHSCIQASFVSKSKLILTVILRLHLCTVCF